MNELKLGDWEASQCRNLQAPGHFNLIPRREVWAKSRDPHFNKGEDLKIPIPYQDKVFSYYNNLFLKTIMQKLGCNYFTFHNLNITELP